MTLDYASGARGEEIPVSFSYNRPYKLHISLSTPTFMNTIELSQKLIEYKENFLNTLGATSIDKICEVQLSDEKNELYNYYLVQNTGNGFLARKAISNEGAGLI